MKYTITTALILLFCFSTAFAQLKQTPSGSPANIQKPNIQINTEGLNILSKANTHPTANYQQLSPMTLTTSDLDIYRDETTGQAIWIKGIPDNMDRSKTEIEDQAFAYLEAIKNQLKINNPAAEFTITKSKTDANGESHLRLAQSFNNTKIYGAEIALHTRNNKIQLFNGRYYPTPTIDVRNIELTKTEAEDVVKNAITAETTLHQLSGDALSLIDGEPLESELMIYHIDNDPAQAKMVWKVKIIPNVTHKWEYFIDAKSGEILNHYKDICQFFGWHEDHEHHSCSHHKTTTTTPTANDHASANFFNEETAFAQDLQGITREINVWRTGSTYIMVDASRNMFNAAQSNLPNSATGVIGTFDAGNNSVNSGQDIGLVNHGNNNSWTQNEVSAHFNAGVAYEYFRTTFGRNSIKNQGENIFSVINVTEDDGSQMDNAFWNGETMFYGNGNQAFNAPLAKATDVAGHEMAHGVVQSTANLVYQGESGAMNESFADIFGAMIDREDWQIGEEVSNPNVFPSGTMRDMANPNNGGSAGNFYWQPAHYDERYTGSQDNGGVHINSGIPNHAYYLFATTNGIGKSKAEQIFYKALDDYLVMSSQFIDMRIAVIQAATDLHGANSAEVTAAQSAFSQVGIGEAPGGNYQNDVNANPGDQFILWSDANLSNVNTSATTSGFPLIGAFTENDHLSRASISDDGSLIAYVKNDGSLQIIQVDWASGQPQITNAQALQESLDWRNVAVSKDGTKVAAVYGNLSQNVYDNEIGVFDLVTGGFEWFVLSNPTTANGVSTGNVQYADALEFDITGEYILYDAFNEIPSNFGQDIAYWDIGIVKVWDNGTNSFENPANPPISKLFSNLGDNVSVGNPTFAKNSPYIIAFDHLSPGTNGTQYAVYGVNIQTGEQGVIFENNKPGYPSYSIDDDFVLFSVDNNNMEILGYRAVTESKTAGTGDAFVLIENANWGHFYAIGERDLTNTDDINIDNRFEISPNPTSGQLMIDFNGSAATATQVNIFDNLGRILSQKQLDVLPGNTNQLDLSNMTAGTYLIQIITEEGYFVKKILKL